MPTDFSQSFDAQIWAEAFIEHVKVNPSIATDQGAMIGWFANAIMRGFDEATRQRVDRVVDKASIGRAILECLSSNTDASDREVLLANHIVDLLKERDAVTFDHQDPPEVEKLLEDTKLPCEIKINHMAFGKGVSLGTLVGATRRWHRHLSEFYVRDQDARRSDAGELAEKLISYGDAALEICSSANIEKRKVVASEVSGKLVEAGELILYQQRVMNEQSVPHRVLNVLSALVNLKRIKRKIEAGSESSLEELYYTTNKEKVWQKAELVLSMAKSKIAINLSVPTNFQRVMEFHQVFDHPVGTKPDLYSIPASLILLRLDLKAEEFAELIAAVTPSDEKFVYQLIRNAYLPHFDHLQKLDTGLQVPAENLVKVFDALLDDLYVTYGFGVCLGLPMDEGFREVHDSNMSKLDEEGKPIKREDGKILKGPHFFEPDLKRILGEYSPMVAARTSRFL